MEDEGGPISAGASGSGATVGGGDNSDDALN